MKRRFLGLLACTVVLGLGGLGAAGCGSDATTVVDDGSDATTPADGTTPEGGDEVVPPAPTAEDCAVAGDEDADGASDCSDTDCAADPACALPPPAIAEGDCTDGLDADADGAVDCGDTDCAADPACALPPPVAVEDCSTAADEDGDGQGQCSDSDCIGDPACSGGGSDPWELNPHIFDKYKAVEKFPWPGPGPECLSCPDGLGIHEDMVTNPAFEKDLGAQYGF